MLANLIGLSRGSEDWTREVSRLIYPAIRAIVDPIKAELRYLWVAYFGNPGLTFVEAERIGDESYRIPRTMDKPFTAVTGIKVRTYYEHSSPDKDKMATAINLALTRKVFHGSQITHFELLTHKPENEAVMGVEVLTLLATNSPKPT